METQWYLITGGRTNGPFSALQLRELALAGRLWPGDLVRQGQTGEPVPVEQVKGLLSENMRGRLPPPLPTSSERNRPKSSFVRLALGSLTALMLLLASAAIVITLYYLASSESEPSVSELVETPSSAVAVSPSSAVEDHSSSAADDHSSSAAEDRSSGAVKIPEPHVDENRSSVGRPDAAERDGAAEPTQPEPSIIAFTDDFGIAGWYSNEPISVLHGMEERFVKQIPEDQMRVLSRVEELCNKARMTLPKAANPAMTQLLAAKLAKEALDLDAILPHLPTDNPQQPEWSIQGWIGRIHIGPAESTITLGMKSQFNTEPAVYGLGLRSKRAPDTVYRADGHSPVISVALETRELVESVMMQFASLRSGDWVRVTIPRARVYTVGLIRCINTASLVSEGRLIPVHGGILVRISPSALYGSRSERQVNQQGIKVEKLE